LRLPHKDSGYFSYLSQPIFHQICAPNVAFVNHQNGLSCNPAIGNTRIHRAQTKIA
jgi:hypothetical protein